MEITLYIVIPLLAILYGYAVGLLNILSKIGIIILSTIITVSYTEQISEYLHDSFGVIPVVDTVAAAIVAFVLSTIVLKALLFILHKLLDITHLNIVNRILGAVLAGGIGIAASQALVPLFI